MDIESMMDQYKQTWKINKEEYKKENVSLCKELEDHTNQLTVKLESEYLMNKAEMTT